MERKFYPENFERFLKSHTDQFKMTPSKKVWHGIYNDLHPGRRWPSVAMSIVFIFTLVIIGHLNTNNGDKSLHPITTLQTSDQQPLKNAVTYKQQNQVANQEANNIVANPSTKNIIKESDETTNGPLLSVIKENNSSLNNQEHLVLPANKLTSISESDQTKNNFPHKNQNDITPTSRQDNISTSIPPDAREKESIHTTNTTPEPKANGDIKEIEKTKEISTSIQETITHITPEASAANISKPKRINHLTWTYYVSPSISYRSISDDNISNAVTHKSIMGYEGGVSLSFKLYKKLQFTTGLQLNYSGYNIRAYNTHPIVASLVLNSDGAGQQQVYYTMSHYGNKKGTEFITLKNYNLQASLPVGVQFAFAGNDNIKFNAAATLQPSYSMASNAYMLSDDKRNYLTNPSLYRKWNMNTSFAAYVSFSSNSFNWQIGPQVRYQLLSTYSNRYPAKENLVNYGIRIAVSKTSK